MNTPIYRQGDLLMVAVARLFLDNFRNIQISWVKEGIKMARAGPARQRK